ncbi:MAG: PEP-CTERM sorting domain-containing protein [Planctomycetota bacterium]
MPRLTPPYTLCWAACLAVLTTVGSAARPALAADPDEFLDFSFSLRQDASVDLPGRLFVPDQYDGTNALPLVVFYHGAGQVGSNNTSQVNANIDNLLAAAKREGFFLYAPQASSGWGANAVNLTLNQAANAVLDYGIDTSRLYVTGLSLGGQGVWNTLANHPGVFAAATPIAAPSDIPGSGAAEQANAAALAGSPIWAYHAVNDGTVNVNFTRRAVNSLRDAAGLDTLDFPLQDNDGSPFYTDGSTYLDQNNLRYTEYASGGHAVWGRAYNEQPLYDWMLDQSNPLPTLAVGQSVLYDMGATATTTDDQGRLWNSPAAGYERTPGVGHSFALTPDGQRTALLLEVTDIFTGQYRDGLEDPSLSAPASVRLDGWTTSANTNANAQDAPGQLTLHHLTPGGEYRLELFASRPGDDNGRQRITRYLIDDLFRDLDVQDNLDQWAVFESVFADEFGRLTIDVVAAEGTLSRSADLGALRLTALDLEPNPIPEPTTLGMTALAFLALATRRRSSRTTRLACGALPWAEGNSRS